MRGRVGGRGAVRGKGRGCEVDRGAVRGHRGCEVDRGAVRGTEGL